MIKACTVLAVLASVHVLASTVVDNALKYASKHTSEYDKDLVQLASIPSISSLPEHAQDVERAAAWLTDRMKGAGLEVRRYLGICCKVLRAYSPFFMHIHAQSDLYLT